MVVSDLQIVCFYLASTFNSNSVTICIYFVFLFSEKTSNGDYHISKGRYLKNVTHSPMNILQGNIISAADIKLVSNDIFCTHVVIYKFFFQQPCWSKFSKSTENEISYLVINYVLGFLITNSWEWMNFIAEEMEK